MHTDPTNGAITLGDASDPFSKVTRDDVEGCELAMLPTLTTWVESRKVYDFNVDMTDPNRAGHALMRAYMHLIQSGKVLARVGDPHQDVVGAYVVSASLKPSHGADGFNLIQTIRYAMPGDFAEVSYEVYQQTEVRNFAIDKTGTYQGKDTTITVVPYGAVGNMGAALTANWNPDAPFVADIQVPSLLKAMRVTQYETLDPATWTPAKILEAAEGDSGSAPPSLLRPVWNSDEFWGFKPGKLLFMGVQSATDGTRLYRRTYSFLFNPYGWHHFYAIVVDSRGKKPMDVTPIDPTSVQPTTGTYNAAMMAGQHNGAAAFRMLDSVAFASHFSHIKPPLQRAEDTAAQLAVNALLENVAAGLAGATMPGGGP